MCFFWIKDWSAVLKKQNFSIITVYVKLLKMAREHVTISKLGYFDKIQNQNQSCIKILELNTLHFEQKLKCHIDKERHSFPNDMYFHEIEIHIFHTLN